MLAPSRWMIAAVALLGVSSAQTQGVVTQRILALSAARAIAEAALAMLLEATPWEIALSVHPHPTISEVIGEAALAVDGRAIQISHERPAAITAPQPLHAPRLGDGSPASPLSQNWERGRG